MALRTLENLATGLAAIKEIVEDGLEPGGLHILLELYSCLAVIIDAGFKNGHTEEIVYPAQALQNKIENEIERRIGA